MIRRFALAAALAVLTLLAGNTPASAHKMKVFATAEGAAISGYAYFSSGSRAMQAKVTATGADGIPVFEGVTDDQGQFAFPAVRRMDHVITVDGGDGHMATFTITAAELPESLPPAGPASATPAPVSTPPAEIAPNDLRAFIDQSIARQIRPLREQLDAYQEKIWWHDVIGGIGYIVGVAGFAFGWANRQQARRKGAIKEEAAP